MARLEDLTRGAHVAGIRSDGPVEVLDARWHGTSALELTYKAPDGKPGSELLFRDREASLEIATKGPALTVETQAELPDGAPHDAVRTASENCRTLKFKSAAFEEE